MVVWREIRAFWLVLSWSGFRHGNGHKMYVFCFRKLATEFKTNMARVPYNKLLTNLACSSRTGNIGPRSLFVRTSLRSVCTATKSGQYSPVRASHSVSKRLISNDMSNYIRYLNSELPLVLIQTEMKPSAKHEGFAWEQELTRWEKTVFFEILPIMKQLSDISHGIEKKHSQKTRQTSKDVKKNAASTPSPPPLS